jgi:hypothetical protein
VGEACQASASLDFLKQNCRKEEVYKILIQIKIIFKNLFFYTDYSKEISKNGLKWLKYKCVSKFSGYHPTPSPGKKNPYDAHGRKLAETQFISSSDVPNGIHAVISTMFQKSGTTIEVMSDFILNIY